jgi:Heterokaryon incompatibility protein (HET)
MRLVNTETLKLEYFVNQDSLPEYAILSHTWGEEEVTYQELTEGTASLLKGWLKLERFCSLARRHSWRYVWVDTCCIDKKSSSELSEAINSMFEWYSNAEICYAYLEDVGACEGDPFARKAIHRIEMVHEVRTCALEYTHKNSVHTGLRRYSADDLCQ